MSRPLVERLWGRGWRRLLAGDAAVLLALVGLIVVFSLRPAAAGRPERAEVLTGGRRAALLDLRIDGVSEFAGPLGATKVEVLGRRVRVLSSPCPLQVCRHGGWIARPGEMLVCLPNTVVVRIPGRDPDAPDALSR